MIDKIGILYHPMKVAAKGLADELTHSLEGLGVASWSGSSWDRESAQRQLGGTGMVLAVGGDGTIMRAAQIVLGTGIPIAGVNLGRLGLLTELTRKDFGRKLPRLIAGQGWRDKRAMLEVTLKTSGQSFTCHALNDAVLARGGTARVIGIQTSIDGRKTASYRADGIVAATATGSTGYSLALGGPVVYPDSADYVVTPIAPHLSPSGSLLLPAAATLTLQVEAVHPALLCIDGHINLAVGNDDIITIRRSGNTTVFARLRPKRAYYAATINKLKGR